MMKNQLALSGEKILEKVYPQLFHPCWHDSWGILVERAQSKHPITKLSAICKRLSRDYLLPVLR